MTIRRFIDPVSGNVALYTVPNNIGDPDDPLASCNAPLHSPNSNLQYLFFHSAFDPLEVALGPQAVTINHEAIPGGSGPGVGTVNQGQVYGNFIRSHVLVTHNLGYVPDFMLLYQGNVVHPGFPVQYDSADGRARCVTAYGTNTQIILYEFGVQTSNAMPSVSRAYTVLVLRKPPTATSSLLWEYDPVNDIVRMAGDKFRTDRRYLQVVAGGSPFGFPTGRMVDLRNGTFRSVGLNGEVRDVVPATLRVAYGYGGPSFGPSGNYNGSFGGSGSVQVQAP